MEELKILQKTYDMIKYGNLALLQFPKMERYALAGDIKRCMYKILELIIRANKTRNKKPVLYEIDVELDILRTFIRFAADKDAFIQRLGGDYTVTDYDEPSAELLARVESKKFNTIAAAKAFIDGEKTDKDRIDDLELLILELGGII